MRKILTMPVSFLYTFAPEKVTKYYHHLKLKKGNYYEDYVSNNERVYGLYYYKSRGSNNDVILHRQ